MSAFDGSEAAGDHSKDASQNTDAKESLTAPRQSAFSVPAHTQSDSILSSTTGFQFPAEFRSYVSEFLDSRVAVFLAEFEDMKKDVSFLKSRVEQLEREKSELADTVQFLTSDPPVTAHSAWSSSSSASPEPYKLTDIISEELDRTNRACNIVVRGIPDAWDSDLNSKVCNLFESPTTDVVHMERLRPRKRKPDARSGNSESCPVRVCLRSKRAKSQFYKKRFGLKVDDNPVYVNNDLTKEQWTKRKENLDKYKQLRTKGVTCSIPYGDILDDNGKVLTACDVQALLSQ